MEYGYILKITNKNIYREIQLMNDQEQLKLGIDMDCHVRFYRELFFENFKLVMTNLDGVWQLTCSDNIYIDVGDVRKLVTKKLKHGDSFSIKYNASENELFRIDFLFDFDNELKDYSRIIDVSGMNTISIGEAVNNSIILKSPYIKGDNIELGRDGKDLVLKTCRTLYGVYHNGKKAAAGDVIRDGDFFSIANFSFYYRNGCIRTTPQVIVNTLQYTDDADRNTYPKFNRNTRIRYVLDEEKIEIMDPPAIPQKPKNNILMRLMPALVMVGAAIVMGIVSGGTMIIFSVISGLMGVVTGIVSIVESNKEFKKKSAERIEKYNHYIDNKKKEIQEARKAEEEKLNDIYIGHTREVNRFASFSSDLFDRAPDDEDFLSIRLGTGKVEAKKTVDYKKQERLEIEDDLQEMPKKLHDEYRYIHEAPVTCSLKETNAVGIIGDAVLRFEIMKNMVIDICARQYHTDVKLFFISEEENRDKIHWLRMLPHTYNDAIDTRNIAADDESKSLIFEYLYKELTVREQNKEFDNNLVVFLYDEYGFKNHPVSKFVKNAGELGATFVFFADVKADISLGCDYLVDIKDLQHAVLIDTSDSSKSSEFVYPNVTDSQAEDIVRLLAPVYTEEISLEGSLTKNISMFQLMNIIAVEDIDLSRNWSMSQADKSMAAPVGVAKNGVVYLDLHDKAHGPHGLVAGTTGSGKSELLQTYILSMATLYHPHEVGFLIIDFKGGGMVNQFKELPHLLGAITNIDGKEINRSLKSIKAELKKRQRLFADADVNHIDKYIKKYKGGEAATPLPHLIIIVDEFAELKAEQPDFMKELISAARIGRSLGVHLILATQKPSGQVNEQIWSNSRFKLCLKVQSQEDSNEVLKSPLAAEIKEAGRAYLQVGNNEIFELFQSAYSGAPERADDNNMKEFSIYSFNESGKRVPVYTQKKQKSNEGSSTQLDAIVNYVNKHCGSVNIEKLPNICLPSLGEIIDFTAIRPDSGSTAVTAQIGVYDDPDNQYQGIHAIDITNQNVMIIGSAQSGKTNILQTIIRSLATKYTPEEMNIYIMDFASMVLKNFEPLNHVGGVVTPAEDEKLKNLMKLLYKEIEQRKEKLLKAGVSSFAAYREAGKTDLPQIVLMIDNLTALKELYFQDDDDLLRLCREGLSAGICVIIANSQTSGIGYKYLSNFSGRIALFCNDSGEYAALFDHCRERIEDIHGRCIIEIDKQHLECQTYLAFKGEKEIQRVDNIRKFIAVTNDRVSGMRAAAIPEIPEVLTTEFVMTNLRGYMKERFELVVGIDYASVNPFVIRLNAMNSPLVVSGREGMGRHNFIKYAVNMLDRVHKGMTEVHVFDNIGKKLSPLDSFENVKTYDFLANGVEDIITSVETELKSRYDRLLGGEEKVLEESSLIVLVINNSEILTTISNNMTLYDSYKNITGKYKKMNVCVIIGDYENANISYMAPDLIRNLRDNKHFLFFDDVANMKIVDMPLAVTREYRKAIDRGDCYYVRENVVMKVKTVRR